jgi:uncharacterized protein YjiS (DUF1127 family)
VTEGAIVMPDVIELMPPVPYDAGRRTGAGQRARSRGLAVPGARLIAIWIERTRQRRSLSVLDERLLRDIGVTPSDARRECAKPFWR